MQPDDDKTQAVTVLSKGTVINHYRIVEKIGAGGMGDVYLADDTSLDRKVALKFLSPYLCQDEDCRKRFAREAHAAARLQHPNIVTIHEVGEYRGRPFMATEYAGEVSLRDIIGQKILTQSEAVNIAIQICEGLQEAHNSGIVHRDIKPSNIVLEKSGHPKIVDFGLASVRGAAEVTKSGSTMGTPSYMSPEQLRGGNVDHRSDLFSLGVVLYEMVTSKHPFAAEHDETIQHLILSANPEPLSRYKKGIPPELQEVVEKALKKDPEKRYQSATEMIDDLRHLRRLSSEPVKGRRIYWPLTRGGWLKSRYVILAAILILLSAATWKIYQFNRTDAHSPQRLLAVLPFVNLGSDPTNQTLCDGLMETITSKLTQLSEFEGSIWVLPASEIRDKKVVSAGQARKLFGVNLVLTGSVQPRRYGVRITCNLVDVVTKHQLRSAVLDEPMPDVLALQDSIVEKLAQMLDIQLRPESRRLMGAGGTSSSAAYYSYLQGRGYLQRYENVNDLDSAISLFKDAIKHDSGYALAYAGLGDVYWQKYKLSMEVQWVAPAISNSNRALELNDQLAPVFVTLGMIHRGTGRYEEAVRYLQHAIQIDSMENEAYLELASSYESLGRFGEAESTYRIAIQRRPDYWLNYYYLALFNLNRGHRDDALRQTASAEKLAPDAAFPCSFIGGLYAYLMSAEKAKMLLRRSIDLAPNYAAYSNLGVLYQQEEQFENAIDMYERALKLDDRDYRVWINLASMYEQLPNGHDKAITVYDSAIALGERNREINPNDPLLLCYLAESYVAVGEREKSMALVRQAKLIAPENSEVMVRAGLVYESAGRRDDAMALIREAVEKGFPIEQIRGLDELRSMVSDPRFDSIVASAKHFQSRTNK